MIKFFRTIRKSLLMENKPASPVGRTAKYFKYAIGEIVLVVIGILIALSINNWNQKRLERIQEKSMLSNLHYEFLQNKTLVTDLLKIIDGTQKANSQLMKLMGAKRDELQKHNLDSLFYESFTASSFTSSGQSISNIIQGGNLNSIQNKEIIELIYKWEAQLEKVHAREMKLDTWNFSQVLPFTGKYISFKEIDAHGKFDWTGKSKLKKDYYPIFQSLEFENILDNLLWMHQNNYDQLKKAEIIINQMINISKPYKE